VARIVITGANRGIGLALARAYKARGDKVVAACRVTSTDLDALGIDIREGVEVSDDAAVDRFASSLTGTVDVLINNAGIHTNETLDDLSFDRIRRQYEVNALGPLRVTRALLPRLGAGGKVVIVTSRSDRRQRIGSHLWLPHVEGGGEHGRRQPGDRPQAAGDRRPAPSSRHGADRYEPFAAGGRGRGRGGADGEADRRVEP
jgi:NAD(P)-dependent dehydrogenase (short-subunit alcohol dehydrogenase family)